MLIFNKNKLLMAQHIIVLTIFLFSISSYNLAIAGQNVVIDVSKPISATQLAAYNRDGIAIDIDKTPVLKQVFVTNKEGAIARQLPSGASRKVKSYTFGEQLEIIENQADWYGVRDRIYREYDNDNDGIIETDIVKWEKVYIKKDQTGSINKIALTAKDLNIISHLSISDDHKYFEEEKALNKYLKIELIDKAMFEKKRPLAINFLSKDNAIKKRNGVLSIPTTKKVVKFTDNDVDNDGYQIFDYVGQIGFLDQYLISGSYYEIGDYTLIDKRTGETTQTFIEYPYISPNKKYIIAIYTNPYEQTADVELYKINEKDITPIVSTSFIRWMPAVNPEDIFWARDGYLYLAVNHSAAFWKADGSLNDNYQYIRIKVDI